jgi:hypothetical protein
VPIYVNAGSTTASSVQGNTISNISYSSTGQDITYLKFIGIFINTSTKANVGNTTGNTVGSSSVSSAITLGGSGTNCQFYGILYKGIEGVSISNNTVAGINVSHSSSGYFYALGLWTQSNGNFTVDGNTIGSTSVSNSIDFSNTGNTIAGRGIYISAGNTSGTTTVSNNVVTSLTNQSTTFGYIYGMYFTGGYALNVTNNQVYNLKFAYNYNQAAAASDAMVGMYFGSSLTTATVSGNAVHTLQQTNASSTSWTIRGIQINSLSTSNLSVFEKNNIHSISSPDIGGIYASIVGYSVDYGKLEFRNNMIALGNKPDGTSLNATPSMVGIWIWGNQTYVGCFHNTIAIVGNVTGTATRESTCFYSNASTQLVVKNNIFYNARSYGIPGSYWNACIFLLQSTICDGYNAVTSVYSNYDLDYNCYYFSGTGGVVSQTRPSFTAWQNYTRQDYNSIFSNPRLTTPSGSASTVDLHIDVAQASPVEGAGLAIAGITDDFDGDLRSSLTPVDIGADAGNFTNYDAFAPGITYTKLTYKPGNTTDNSFTASFFDPHGVASGSLAPRVYFRKNSGTWYSSQGSYVSGDATSAVYTMTVSASAMGGLAIGDLVEYYVIAQENTNGYVGSRPSGVTASNVNTVTSAPTTLMSFRAGSTLTGTFQVGSAQSAPYNSLSNAINAYNSCILTGPVVFELTDANYTLTSTAIIYYNTETSATNTFTIRPAASVSTVISGNVSTALIQIKGNDYVTIDGSNNGTTSRDLTLTNTYSGSAVIHLADGTPCSGGGATNGVFKNLNINGSAAASGYGIYIGSTTLGSSGPDFDNNTFTNNVITKAGSGIYFNSSSTTSDNNTISNNTIGSNTATSYITDKGIYLTYVTSSSVSGNTIFNLVKTTNNIPVGLEIGNSCSSVTAEKNLIYGVKYTGSNAYGGCGIKVTSNSHTIKNNILFDIGGKGSTTAADMIAGIYNTGSSNLFYYNTVSLFGDYNGYSTTTNTATAFYNTGTTGVNVRNNIFYNVIGPASGSTNAKSYAIMMTGIPATINYNDYYADGQNPVLGYLSSDKTTIEAWRTATSQDGNSLNSDPVFASLGGTTAESYTPGASLSGVTIAGITTDYNGMTRAATPTMGALEGNTTTWTGAVSTDWAEPGNWTFSAVPTASINVTIPDVSNDPIVNEAPSSPAEVNSLTIESGAVLTIAAGKALTVNGTITNSNGTSGIVIESSASGTGSLLNNTASVGATINRYIPGLSTSWHFLSSPVASQAISPAFTTAPSTTYDFFTWYEPSDVWVNFKNNTNNPTWTTANGSANFVTGRGYLVQYTGTGLTKQFQGNMNTGAVTYPLTISGTGIYATYNLAGNPYPCAIDWKAASGWTRSSLASSGGGTVMYIWNDASRNYGSFNSAGSSGTNGVTQYIPSGQGFFVKAASAGNLGMDDGIKVHNGASFLKESIANILKLNVTGSGMSSSDEMVIEFGHPDATGGAEKMFSFDETAPSLYTIKDNVNYSIDFRGAPATLSIPVNFKAGSNGQYSLTASQLESFSNVTKITLEDKQAGKTQELTSQAVYHFSATKEDNEARFVLHFGGAFGTGEASLADRYQITSQGHQIMIYTSASSQEAGEAVLYNLTGQMIGKATLQGNGNTIIPAGNFTGYCLVRISAPDGIFCYKIFVGNK